MQAVDTNVLVRFLTEDDPKQAPMANAVFERGLVWIAKTVLLETAWVLQDSYITEPGAIVESFLKLLGMPAVVFEDPQAVTNALRFVQEGLDFADALHLSSMPPGAKFVSFDRKLVRRAQRSGLAAVEDAHVFS